MKAFSSNAVRKHLEKCIFAVDWLGRSWSTSFFLVTLYDICAMAEEENFVEELHVGLMEEGRKQGLEKGQHGEQ